MTITPTQDAPGTPLPWECHKTLPLIHHWKQGPDDDTGNVLIAEVGSHRDAELEPFNGDRWLQDARYIVLACNAYPELVAALEAVVASSPIEDSVLPMVLDALSKAKAGVL